MPEYGWFGLETFTFEQSNETSGGQIGSSWNTRPTADLWEFEMFYPQWKSVGALSVCQFA
jgi:hypothetical protein